MSETLFSLLMAVGAVGIFWLGWHLRGEHDRPTVTTQPPTSHVTRPSHHIDVKTAPYKIPSMADRRFIGYPDKGIKAGEPLPANLLEPIEDGYTFAPTDDLHGYRKAANKRNRERILANMRAGKRNN